MLISLNSYFTENEWLEKISNLDDEFDFYFVKNKFRFIKLITGADYIFCFGLSSFIEARLLTKKKIYFGVVGLEFLKKVKLPSSCEVFSPKGISTMSIAEYCLAMSINLNLKLYYAFNNKLKKMWDQSKILNKPFISIKKKTIGIMGVGNNGKAIAEIFKNLGCHVNGYDKIHSKSLIIDDWFYPDRLDLFLSNSDVVIVALSENPETKHLINLEFFKMMKKDSILINIARGNIINEDDLIIALKNKYLSAVALDTLITEPLPRQSKLWKFENVIVTPHIAGNINLFRDQIQKDFIKTVLKGKVN